MKQIFVSLLLCCSILLSCCAVREDSNVFSSFSEEKIEFSEDNIAESSFYTQSEKGKESKESEESEEYEEYEESEVVSSNFDIPVISQPLFHDIASAALYESDSLRPIYEQNVHETLSVASITKLVTAAVTLKFASPDKVCDVGSEIELVPKDSSFCGLKSGQKLTLYDLLTGLLMCSGNDAAYTIAVNVAREISGKNLGNEEALAYFSDLMNAFAQSVGMTSSHFVLPDGYEADGQFSTAYDLAKIAQYAMNNEIIAEIVATAKKTVTIESGEIFEWNNSNFFLHENSPFYDPRVTGLKTGYTSVAGKCLISTFNLDGKNYIAIVLGCETDEQRYGYSRELIEYIERQINNQR